MKPPPNDILCSERGAGSPSLALARFRCAYLVPWFCSFRVREGRSVLGRPPSRAWVLPTDPIHRFKAGPVSSISKIFSWVFRVPRGASLRTRIHDLKTKYYALREEIVCALRRNTAPHRRSPFCEQARSARISRKLASGSGFPISAKCLRAASPYRTRGGGVGFCGGWLNSRPAPFAGGRLPNGST